MKYFPVFLNLQGKTAVVFGGGADAAAKLRLLQKTDANLHVVTEHLDADVLTLGQATWIKAAPETFELPGNTALVYAATGDDMLDATLVERAQSQGALACAVDQPGPSDFITPAIVDRDPIVVAIGTEGTAPVLARDIKSKVEALLEPTLGAVARVAHRLRPLVSKVTRPGGQRRAFWHDFFASARVQPARATEIGHSLLADVTPSQAKLSFIDAPAGQSSLSKAGREALHTADVLVVEGEVAPSVLELARREALHLRSETLDSSHVAQALAANQHVALIRRQAGPDHLSEVAAGFGVLATIYASSVLPVHPTFAQAA